MTSFRFFNLTSNPTTPSTSNQTNPTTPQTPITPSIDSIPLNSPSSSTSFSFRRSSLNFIRTRSPSTQSHPASIITLNSRSSIPTSTSLSALRPSIPTSVSKCSCCSSILHLQSNSHQLQCSICGIHWELLSPKNDLDPPINFVITSSHVRQLRSLAPTPNQLKAFDEDPTKFMKSTPEAEAAEKFYTLAATLITSLFENVQTLSSAFTPSRLPDEPDQSPVGLRIRLARGFFGAVVTGPGGRDLLSAHLSRFLSRPGPEIWAILHAGPNDHPDSATQLSHWAWAAILFECAGILATSSLKPKDRFGNTSRLFGLISNLPNHLHHQLVGLYKHPDYPLIGFQEKITEANTLIGDRLSRSLSVAPSFTETISPRYANDWIVLAASRVMTLLFGANLKSHKVPVANFYNTPVDLLGPIELAADFERWETSTPGYSLCGFPCLLSICAKIAMLTHEGKRQMGAEARQALVDGLLGRGVAQPVLQLTVRRSHLVEDSLRQIENAHGELKKLLKIRFVGEDGVDGGGLKKEWFLLLIRQLVAPEYGMFVRDSESQQLWFNPASTELGEFRLIGTVVGLAIYNRATLDISLPLVCYKKLLGRSSVTLSDLAGLRPGTAQGLRQLLEWDLETVEETFDRMMVGEYEDFGGRVIEVALKPNGQSIPITAENREEFVERYVDFLLNKSVRQQFKAFKDGFDAVASGNALSLFQPEEIELVVSGSRERLDLDTLSNSTEYEGYTSQDVTIQAFWSYVGSLDESGERRLLSFITGTDRIPAMGTSGLKLKISRELDLRRLPSSHTCFNQLLLPALETVEAIEDRLGMAMRESEGFGLH